SGAAATETGRGFTGAADAAAATAGRATSLRRVAWVAPGVLPIGFSRRLRVSGVILPSLCPPGSRSVWSGVRASVTVVTVIGLLSRISTVWPAARIGRAWGLTLASRSGGEPGLV